MSEHAVTIKDETVRNRPGTTAKCSCGWSSSWGIRDGSAEADAHHHQVSRDSEYRERHLARVEDHSNRERERGCICKMFTDDFGFMMNRDCPIHGPKPSRSAAQPSGERCHSCSCHINPPCGACENCAHYDHPNCPNDCQDCEDDHE